MLPGSSIRTPRKAGALGRRSIQKEFLLTRRYLVLSDLHLADVENHEDGWKYYKQRRFVPDEELRKLIGEFIRESPEDSRKILLLNGDVLDFDLISPSKKEMHFKVSPFERRWGLRPTSEKSVWKIKKILHDHDVFIEALVDLLENEGEIVYVMGNHDRELHFKEVQDAFLNAVEEKAVVRNVSVDRTRIRFEPWFYYVKGEIYAEHGQQYDFYTTFRHVLSPVVKGSQGEEIALPMGNISNRYLMSRMGYFNPHASDYILNVFAYITHWLRYYAFSRRSLALSWFIGSLVVMHRLLRTKRKRILRPKNYAELINRQGEKYGLPPERVERLYRLRHQPITNTFFKIIREFWIDRVVLSALMIGGTIVLALVPIPMWIKLMVPLTGFPLLFFIYESILKGETVLTVERHMPARAAQVAKIIDDTSIITFGHSHIPRLIPLKAGVSFVDTGTWAPITKGAKGSKGSEERSLDEGYRNYLICTFKDEPSARIEFGSRPVN